MERLMMTESEIVGEVANAKSFGYDLVVVEHTNGKFGGAYKYAVTEEGFADAEYFYLYCVRKYKERLVGDERIRMYLLNTDNGKEKTVHEEVAEQ